MRPGFESRCRSISWGIASALANATFTEKFWWILFIYGRIYMEVEGDPIMKKTEP